MMTMVDTVADMKANNVAVSHGNTETIHANVGTIAIIDDEVFYDTVSEEADTGKLYGANTGSLNIDAKMHGITTPSEDDTTSTGMTMVNTCNNATTTGTTIMCVPIVNKNENNIWSQQGSHEDENENYEDATLVNSSECNDANMDVKNILLEKGSRKVFKWWKKKGVIKTPNAEKEENIACTH